MNFLSSALGGNNDGSEQTDIFNPFQTVLKLDKNGDQKITEEDFVCVIEKLGIGSVADGMARKTFQTVDKDNTGTLDKNDALLAYDMIKNQKDEQE